MKKTALLGVIVCLATASTVLAQTRFVQIIEIQVAPAHQTGFENMAMKIKEAADEVESPVTWNMFQVVAGQPSPTYHVTLGFDTWAVRDQWGEVPEMLTEAFGEREAGQVLRDGRIGIVNEVSRIWERLPDGSSNVRTSTANYYMVTVRHVRRDMVPEYRELQRTWKTAYEAATDGPTVGRAILRVGEGSGATFFRAAAFDTWAERDSNRGAEALVEQLGEEGNRLTLEARDRAVERQETFIVAHRPDLSRAATAPTSD